MIIGKAAMAEWLRRLTRNQMGLPAQVQILFAAYLFYFFKVKFFNLVKFLKLRSFVNQFIIIHVIYNFVFGLLILICDVTILFAVLFERKMIFIRISTRLLFFVIYFKLCGLFRY